MSNARTLVRLLAHLLALFLGLLGAGCDRGGATTSSSSGPPIAPTAPTVPATGAPVAGLSCDGLVKKFDDELERAPGTCATDADCGCFPGGISPKRGCGGITDLASTKRLGDIQAEYGRAACRNGIACAAWSCMPICEAGRCVNGPRAPR